MFVTTYMNCFPSINRLFNVSALLVSVLILAGCGGRGAMFNASISDYSGDQGRAQDAESVQDYLLAAREYTLLANSSVPPAKQNYQLLAVSTLLQGRQIRRAENLLAIIEIQGLPPVFQIRKSLLEARIASLQNNHYQAEAIIGRISVDNLTPPDIRADFHRTRAAILAENGNAYESARELTLLSRYLESSDEKLANNFQIYQTLTNLSPEMIDRMNNLPPPDVFGGWIALVSINKRFGANPDALEEEQRKWRKLWPDHPAKPDDLPATPYLTEHRTEQKYRHVALLLPLTSKFAPQAKAVRDGFMSAYYAETSPNKPIISVYDVSNDDNSRVVYEKYRLAVDNGADFVVGPLSKASVDALSGEGSLPVPTLALNYSDDNGSNHNLYQFGLSPEDEAKQAAERIWLDGHSQGIAIVPQGSWGERVYNAFLERWTQLGGKIVGMQNYTASGKDFSTPVKILLNIDESRERAKYIRRLLGSSIKYEERRRQDADFVFVLGFPQDVRQLRPQLKFYHASDMPVYTTSHAYAGYANQQADRDMDGILFSDMPWVLGFNSQYQDTRKNIRQYWPDASEDSARLFALGIDAWSLVNRIEQLQNFQGDRFYGETGYLYMDSNQRIHRQLTWAYFKFGTARIARQN